MESLSSIDELDVEVGATGAKGTINLLAENQPIDLRLDARQFDLEIIPVDLAGLTGRLALDAQIQGSVKKPRVKGRLRLGKPCWQPPGKTQPICFRRLETVGEWFR